MADGELYITDRTANTIGGREALDKIYERIGANAHIVVIGPNDSADDIEGLFNSAKNGALGWFSGVGALDNVIRQARETKMPMLMAFDLNGDKTYDIYSYKLADDKIEKFHLLPGDTLTVRQFMLGHEIGHKDGAPQTNFWNRWRNELESDQDGFKGLGPAATRSFQEGILAARAGNALGEMVPLALFKHEMPAQFAFLVDNPDFIHASTLGIFLEGEKSFPVDETHLNVSLDDFRRDVFERLYDNFVKNHSDFHLNVSVVETGNLPAFAQSLETFVNRQPDSIVRRYEDFINNINHTQDRINQATIQMSSLGDDQAQLRDNLRMQIYRDNSELRSEIPRTLNYMRESNPSLYKQFIVNEQFGAFLDQTKLIPFNPGETQPRQIMRPLLDVVRELDREGTFKDDPIQRRLVDYILKDSQNRPDFYGLSSEERVSGPSEPSSRLGPR
ncbi:MAG: hypothetical protein KA099_05230 [Alphaproteobacteria bacterium]|nr:hypothetical protein [Alphaproteobacteria bacterium]MBP7757695.1 hypothetical protein [Alphaproteobacteria bacterium]MBP7761105.1 hypothetical protein [Alphaproteobacteria bacterium]MBP7904715.1 hypothetical protein [Alphaproteobacteria bacterium]